jgi:hypothetical protein
LRPHERQRIIEQARRVARAEFHPQRAINDLLTMYNRALDLARREPARHSSADALPAPVTIEPSAIVAIPQAAPGAPLVLGIEREFQIGVEHPNWIGLNVLITSRTAAQIKLRVWSKERRLVREIVMSVAPSNEHAWIEFCFDPIVNSNERTFILEFTVTDAARGNQVNLFLSRQNSLYCQMRYAR